MLVECYCGCHEKIEKYCAYPIVLGGTRKVFFLNEQHYHRWQDENTAKRGVINKVEFTPIYELIVDICGGKFDGKTIVWKEYLTWKEVVNDDGDKVKWYLIENKKPLSDYLKKKSFQSDFHKIRYLSTIIKNNVAQYRSSEFMSLPLKECKSEVRENTAVIPNSKKRKSLAELEEEA